ncbi:MAG: hypothetical protein RJA70_2232 [Pseudomonadota bacterium]|jgi:phosphatidylserine/phosphatidylglycerophosphate/cardiolipin synthase-like enzyme
MSNDGDFSDETSGLTDVSTNDLRQLSAVISNGQLRLPLSLHSLAFIGLGHLGSPLSPFSGLEANALLGVIRAILAERRRAGQTRLELVWSGTDSGPSYARYTRIVVPELIDRAQHQITIAGYSFDQGAGIFDRLNEAMHKRGVSARLFLDIEQLGQRLGQQLRKEKSRLLPLLSARQEGSAAYARAVLSLFRELHWTFPTAAPPLYYDPRTADARSFASLHAKCLIVDHEHVLITSANFTGRGQDRNIEVGIVAHDKGYAGSLEQQWNNLVESGDVLTG